MARKGVFTQEFENIVKGIETDIQALLTRFDVQEEFKESVSRAAEKNVYGAYAPTQYTRRGADGMGIADTWNYEVSADKLSLKLVNNTKGNHIYAWTQGWDSGYITDIIESGHGYHWKRSEIYQTNLARPFMEEGLNDFVDRYLIPRLDELLK